MQTFSLLVLDDEVGAVEDEGRVAERVVEGHNMARVKGLGRLVVGKESLSINLKMHFQSSRLFGYVDIAAKQGSRNGSLIQTTPKKPQN